MRASLLPSILGSLVGCALLATTPACTAASDEGTSESDVIGGVDAKGAALEAVGALAWAGEGSRGPSAFCTGTLVAPSIVLTAKHCAVQLPQANVAGSKRQLFTELGSVVFALGNEASQPKRVVKVKGVELAALDEGGAIGFGADMALYTLEEPITDVTPIPVTSSTVGKGDIGKSFIAIGYGIRDYGETSGKRRMGNLTLAMVEGRPHSLLWDSAEEMNDELNKQRLLTPEQKEQARKAAQAQYDLELLAGYEIYAAPKSGDVQVCTGDSGGPLLRKVNGKLRIFGVASWVLTTRAPDPCGGGQVYATFGPTARELVKNLGDGDATPGGEEPSTPAGPETSGECGDATEQGHCEGDVVVRCLGINEGKARRTRTNCADANLTCVIEGGVAACGEP